MSNMSEVREAAAFLDKYCTVPNWRSKINLGCLNMGSSEYCILGQVYGTYLNGIDALREASSFAELDAVEDAFNAYDDEWAQYLEESRTMAQRWMNKEDKLVRVTMHATFDVHGVTHVAYTNSTGQVITCTHSRFIQLFELAPQYKHGHLYTTKGSPAVLVYGDDIYCGKPGFYYLNDSVQPTYAGVSYFEDRFGELTELVGKNALRDIKFEMQM